MILYKKNKAFTLIELIIAITIIWILAFVIANVNFNRLSNKQKLDIFASKIKTSYETIRNSALEWKGIWTNLVIPKKWDINFSTSNSWTISWSAYDEYNNILGQSKIIIPNDYTIKSIKCWEYLQPSTSYNIMSNTWTIEFDWINIKLNTNSDSDCDANKDRILELSIKNKVESKIIDFNTLNWIVEIK